MAKNRIFFPVAALDQWLAEGKVDIRGDELTILAQGRRYRIIEAARIISEVSGLPDANELVGRVKSRAFLTELGAELLENSMILGDNAYEVVPGFLGAPVGLFEDHLKSPVPAEPQKIRPEAAHKQAPVPKNDEDLLAQFLLEGL